MTNALLFSSSSSSTYTISKNFFPTPNVFSLIFSHPPFSSPLPMMINIPTHISKILFLLSLHSFPSLTIFLTLLLQFSETAPSNFCVTDFISFYFNPHQCLKENIFKQTKVRRKDAFLKSLSHFILLLLLIIFFIL